MCPSRFYTVIREIKVPAIFDTLRPTSTRSGTITYANHGYNEGEAHETVIGQIQKGRLRPEHYCDLENANEVVTRLYPGLFEAYEAMKENDDAS